MDPEQRPTTTGRAGGQRSRAGAGTGPALSQRPKDELVRRVLELQGRVETLEDRNAVLEQENAELEALNTELRERAEADVRALAESEQKVTELVEELRVQAIAMAHTTIERDAYARQNEALQRRLDQARKQRDTYRERALVDPTTTLLTRLGMHEWLEKSLRKARREEAKVATLEGRQPQPLSITIIFEDVEKFKLINDTYGHPVGDRVLGMHGRSKRGVLDPQSLGSAAAGFVIPFEGAMVAAARFGGDEQVIIAIGPFDPQQQFSHMAVDFRAMHNRESPDIQNASKATSEFRRHPHSVRVALTTDFLVTGQGPHHVFGLVDKLGSSVKAEDVRLSGRTAFSPFAVDSIERPDELPYAPDPGKLYVVNGLSLVTDRRIEIGVEQTR